MKINLVYEKRMWIIVFIRNPDISLNIYSNFVKKILYVRLLPSEKREGMKFLNKVTWISNYRCWSNFPTYWSTSKWKGKHYSMLEVVPHEWTYPKLVPR